MINMPRAPRFARVVALALTVAVVAVVSASATATSPGFTGSHCPHPSVPVPPNEPVYRTGPTELVSGLYIQGGAIPPPPCKPKPRGPDAGTITVTDPTTGATVATQSVSNGHLAHIALAPGKYTVSGQFAGGGRTSFSPTVTVRPGYKVRQDVFEDVP